MELKQLERFLAVVEQGSLAGAARKLGMTQQAISASVSLLEKTLGVVLLDRAPGGITSLTDHGNVLLPYARSQIAADQRARDALRAVTDAETGTVTIGIGETFSGDVIAEAVTTLHQSRPNLRINMIEGYSEQLLERFYIGEFDFVAVGVSGFALREGYQAEPIYAANDIVACRSNHPLTQKKTLTLKDLEGYGWLVPYSRPSDTDIIIKSFIDEGCEPPSQFLGSDAHRVGMKLLAQNDLLLMTSPTLVLNRFVHQGLGIKVLPIDRPTVRRHANLVLDTRRPVTPAAKALLDNVRTAVSHVKLAELELSNQSIPR